MPPCYLSSGAACASAGDAPPALSTLSAVDIKLRYEPCPNTVNTITANTHSANTAPMILFIMVAISFYFTASGSVASDSSFTVLPLSRSGTTGASPLAGCSSSHSIVRLTTLSIGNML